MSGHSKWSTIKRQKGATDAKKGAVFTKLANVITIAVKQNQGVENAVARAKEANMPKENIQRALDRGANKNEGNLTEAVYEGFGPGGAAIIVETISDNNTRTANELRNVFNKHGGKLAAPGAVSYLFQRVREADRLIFQPNPEMMIKIANPSKLHELLEAIDELDDVQEVYTNVNYAKV